MTTTKKVLVAGISILIVAGIAGAFFYFSKNKSEKVNMGEPTVAKDVEEFRKILENEDDDSLALIDKALNDKKIDYETALIYKVYAIFGDKQLPAEYKSKAPIFGSNVALYEIQVKFSTLSKSTQEKLQPFFTRPEDPTSYINQRYNKNNQEQSSLFIKTVKANRPDTTLYTDFLVSADNKVKVWYPNDTVDAYSSVWDEDGQGIVVTSTTVSKAMAESIKKHLDEDKIMQRYIDLLGKQIKTDGTRGGDDKLDIYVAPAGTDLGVTYGESSTPCSSYILMNISIGDKRDTILKTVLAHEIFHSYQYAYKYDVVKDNWWGEATAVWAEDFIYPGDNTEQTRLSRFFKYPTTGLNKETPPSAHHYSAYIFPFFITKKYGDEFMKKSWNGCDGKDCLKSIDEIIEGGFKQQWKEFTLWNYNKEPAKFYTDKNGFSTVSGDSAKGKETIFINGDNIEINIAEVQPLAARISDVVDMQEDKSIKRVIFKDLKQFTNQLDKKTSIKALIYYKNGKKEVEDWSEKSERSFCIENKDEDFEKVVLITSNADMKKPTTKAKIKVEGKTSCYHINQNDKASAVLYFPYANGGGRQTAKINTSVEVNSLGDTVANAAPEQKYGYLTKWKLNYEFEQIRDSFTVACDTSNVIFDKGWTSRSAGYLEFDLKLKDPNASEGTFSIDMTYGLPHPHGNYEDIPVVRANCISAYVDAMRMNLSAVKGTMKNVYQGRIYDITEKGAKIEIKNSCLYDGCNMATGEPFQVMTAPIILEIKK
ncbi:MAG: hypothetical protein WC349_04755 [Patescibacteria group bacterium]|jgi:hypothetical protein